MPSHTDPAAESPTLPPALQALDAAVRGISGVLDVEQVLQLVVDRVRDLVAAQYAALGENRSYRIPNIASHPESYGFPPNHPPMHCRGKCSPRSAT